MATYRDIPLASTPLGRELYDAGRALGERGLSPAHIMWDADEVLWDWMMFMSDLGRAIPGVLLRRDISHKEYILRKPGMFELLWGLRHAALERGVDARMRIWTNGYPWRVWQIAGRIPGFPTLLELEGQGLAAYTRAPNLFYRQDFVAAMRALWPLPTRRAWLEAQPLRVREAVLTQLARDPFDSSFKLPDLATLIGKDGFGEVEFLVDDSRRNVRRFVSSGRRGVRVVSHAPYALRSRVPNTVWRRPEDAIREHMTTVARDIAAALSELLDAPPGARRDVDGVRAAPVDLDAPFLLHIPNERITSEWVTPMRALRQELGPR